MTRPQAMLAWGLLALAVTAGGGVAAWSVLAGGTIPAFRLWTRASQGEGVLEALGMYGEVPDFALTERSGRTITRADLLGKVWLANFVYTQCTETCPLQSAQVARLQTEFAAEADLRFVSITVDPERDTPAVLSRYAERYGADPVRWLFLTGDKRAIYRLAKEGFHLGVVDPDDPAQSTGLLRWLTPAPAWATHGSKGLIMHSSRLVLVDRRARIRAYHLPDDEPSLDRLRQNLRTLLRETPKAACNIQWPTLPALLMAPVLIVMYVRLARREDQELATRFGEAFEEYAARTPAFVPWRRGSAVPRSASMRGKY